MAEEVKNGPFEYLLFSSPIVPARTIFWKIYAGHDWIKKSPATRDAFEVLEWLDEQTIPYGIAWNETDTKGYLVLNDPKSAVLLALFHPEVAARSAMHIGYEL